MNNLLLDPWFDMEGRRNELGLNPTSKKATPLPTPQPADPVLTQPEAVSVAESVTVSFSSFGSLEFNKATKSAENTALDLFSELRNFMPQIEKPAQEHHEEGLNLIPKRESAVLGSMTLELGEKTFKSTKGGVKTIFGALISLFKEEIVFKHLTNEQREAQAKKEQVAKVKAEKKKGFFSRLKEAISQLAQEKMKESMEEQERLGVGGMAIDEKNRILGNTRNRSNQDINSTYHNQETFFAMQREREQKKKEEEQVAAQVKGKGGPLDLNKIAEGGSILSTTGGVGAG